MSKDLTDGALYNEDERVEEPIDEQDVLEVAEALGLSEDDLTATKAGLRDEQIEMALDDVNGGGCEVVVFDA